MTVSTLPTKPWHTPAVASAGVDTLLADARHEVLVMSTRTAMSADPFNVIRRAHHENLTRGVRYRVLVPDAARTASLLGPRLGGLALMGADIRTVPQVPADALVIDGQAVVLPASPTAVAAFRLPGVVTTTTELFERVWQLGVPVTDLPEATELDGRQQKLLRLLVSGSTDEAAALRLGVSVRTVRRMVAGIMTQLGARSRFQAGVKAADRGWLMAEAG